MTQNCNNKKNYDNFYDFYDDINFIVNNLSEKRLNLIFNNNENISLSALFDEAKLNFHESKNKTKN